MPIDSVNRQDMPEVLEPPARKPLISGMTIVVILALTWFLYEPASSGVFLLDDKPNLGALATVRDVESALQFVFSGSAGPVGRPLSLATFLPQAESWDAAARPFIRVNIAIHLLNGLLAWCFFLQLTRAHRVERSDDRWIAIAAMALWLLMPILASSSLMVIQRMTTLAATFVLLGLNAYLYARARIDTSPDAALVGMSAAVILATLCAVLAKENGALLPCLVLVLETTLLGRPQSVGKKTWHAWQWLLLGAPTLLVAGLLLAQVPYSEHHVLTRDWTAWDRLLTEARILWDYLFNAFVARPAEYGPFHDGYPVARSILEPITLIAVIAWLAIIGAAIKWRRRFPLAAFAVLWFITGHLLESTTVALELYFEHRNYLPLIGPVFALCALLLAMRGDYRKYARAGVALYILINAGVLYSVTSLWGNPLGAAGYWHVNAPDSPRAAAHLAAQQMTRVSAPTGVVTLQEFAVRHPEHAYLRLHELTSSCRVSPERDHAVLVGQIADKLPTVRFTYAVGTMLDDLLFAISENDCNGVDRQAGRTLAMAVFRNPRYRDDRSYRNFHYRLLAQIAWDDGDTAQAMDYLQQAETAMRSNELTGMVIAFLAASQRFGDARQYLREAADELPGHPLRRIAGRLYLEQARRDLEQAELLANSASGDMQR